VQLAVPGRDVGDALAVTEFDQNALDVVVELLQRAFGLVEVFVDAQGSGDRLGRVVLAL
jgi:hypothetical protein